MIVKLVIKRIRTRLFDLLSSIVVNRSKCLGTRSNNCQAFIHLPPDIIECWVWSTKCRQIHDGLNFKSACTTFAYRNCAVDEESTFAAEFSGKACCLHKLPQLSKPDVSNVERLRNNWCQ